MSAEHGIPVMVLRGGSSKGAYFLAEDLPADPAERDDLILRLMGSPDARQIDGLGGGHPLTSKVAIVSPSSTPDADVDYLFLQVVPDRPVVSDAQTCGNLLAGVGPFAIERGLVAATGEVTPVRIRIVNPVPNLVTAHLETPGGRVRYDGDAEMAGAPFPAAPIRLEFPGDGRSAFPTGRLVDRFDGLDVTCVDAGMPVVLLRAGDLALAGDESPADLEADAALRERLERVRLEAGTAMGLGDVADRTVPKLSICSPARHGGLVTTRTFIPHRVHEAIGVLGAVSVVTGVLTEGTVVFDAAAGGGPYLVEHPTGAFEAELALAGTGAATSLASSTVVRTARKLLDGRTWPRTA
ncbi:PrpF domain-containing protein [Agromyces seonyuensis]|uniref:4-oxalomesaconate tautomerase n=1 Tax=Agromyces seonyuensis TaxID=2662446 RepID=A0A6I4NZI8_9MICO|nr:PrpF domain-containing protein [Agromyces seonyuensis]MWB99736.1 4-oxalomesaconate tautomerase [Agromyces seonyuensis]